MGYIQRILLEDEQVLARTRLHWLWMLGSILKEILVVATLAVGYVVVRYYADTSGPYVLIAFAAVGAVVVLSAALDIWRWRSTQFIITTRRVISCRGVLSKDVLDSSLSKINDVLLRQSWVGRIFNYGTIEILTASETAINLMSGISRPIDFKQALLRAKAGVEPGPGGMAEPHKSVTELLEELGSLKGRGMISEAEYETKRGEILRRM